MIHRFGLVAVLAAVLVPTGSAGTPAAPVLRLASSEDVGTLDPQAEWTANLSSFTLLRATCTTLMAFPERLAARSDVVKRILGSGELSHPLGFLDWITGEDEQVGVEARFCGAGAAEAETGVAGEVLELFGVPSEDAWVDGAYDNCCGSA